MTRYTNVPLYTKGEEIFNAVTHIVGGALGVAMWTILILFAAPRGLAVAAVSVFGASVVLLYTMSALYHALPDGAGKKVFRIFDHCTIFLLIAGSYTPFCLLALHNTRLGTVILCAQWACALLGVVGNAIAMNNKAVKALSMVFYVVMGWMIVLAFGPLLQSMPRASFLFLLLGGIAYTAGIVFYALGKRVRYFHSVWHLFDLAGTILHFFSILLLLL